MWPSLEQRRYKRRLETLWKLAEKRFGKIVIGGSLQPERFTAYRAPDYYNYIRGRGKTEIEALEHLIAKHNKPLKSHSRFPSLKRVADARMLSGAEIKNICNTPRWALCGLRQNVTLAPHGNRHKAKSRLLGAH
jgi:hypothetical protein